MASSPARVELLVLGSSGAASMDRRSTACLVGRTLAVDAGALASGLSLPAQRRVRAVLLTHRHFDHLRELPLFLDNVFFAGGPPVRIGAERGTLRALFRHVFNGDLWPDPRRFRPPPAEFFAVRPGEPFRLEGLRVVPFRVFHTVPTLGYLFQANGSAGAVLGDTGYRPEVFRALSRMERLRWAVLEASYPSHLSDLARMSRHLTPELLERGVAIVRRSHPRLRVLATHLKPAWAPQVERELARLDGVTVARDGARVRFL